MLKRPHKGVRGPLVLALVGALSLSACGGGDSEADSSGSPSASEVASPTEETTTSATASATPTAIDHNAAYGLKLPKGVELTREGRHFVYGRTAKVGFMIDKSVGIATLRVKGVKKGSMKDFSDFVVDAKTEDSTPYYVQVTITNVGKTDLGGLVVPLMVTDGNGTLVEQSSFAADFKPCASTPLPAKFPTDTSATVCLAYVVAAPGDLKAVTFRPSPSFDPIDWLAEMSKRKADQKGTKGTKGGASASASPSSSDTAGADDPGASASTQGAG